MVHDLLHDPRRPDTTMARFDSRRDAWAGMRKLDAAGVQAGYPWRCRLTGCWYVCTSTSWDDRATLTDALA